MSPLAHYVVETLVTLLAIAALSTIPWFLLYAGIRALISLVGTVNLFGLAR